MTAQGRFVGAFTLLAIALLFLAACEGDNKPLPTPPPGTATAIVISTGTSVEERGNTATPARGAITTGPAQPTVEPARLTRQPGPTRPPRPTPGPGPYTVGTTGQIVDVWVTLNSARLESSGYSNPPPGLEYLVLNVSLENHGSETQNVSTERTFSVLDAAGLPMLQSFEARQDLIDGKSGGRLAPGQLITGDVAYQVLVGAKGLRFVFKPLSEAEGPGLQFEINP